MNHRTLRIVAAALGAAGVIKYAALLVDENFNFLRSPWAFLLVLSGPVLVGLALVDRKPRAGVVLIGVGSLLWTLITVLRATVGGFDFTGGEYWADYLVMAVGLPCGLVGVVAAIGAIRFLPRSDARPAHA